MLYYLHYYEYYHNYNFLEIKQVKTEVKITVKRVNNNLIFFDFELFLKKF